MHHSSRLAENDIFFCKSTFCQMVLTGKVETIVILCSIHKKLQTLNWWLGKWCINRRMIQFRFRNCLLVVNLLWLVYCFPFWNYPPSFFFFFFAVLLDNFIVAFMLHLPAQYPLCRLCKVTGGKEITLVNAFENAILL